MKTALKTSNRTGRILVLASCEHSNEEARDKTQYKFSRKNGTPAEEKHQGCLKHPKDSQSISLREGAAWLSVIMVEECNVHRWLK